MPGRVRKYIKKQFRRARTFAKKRYGGGLRGIANLASDVYKLKRLVNTERKFVDTNASAQPTSTTPVVVHINEVASGEGPSQRNGRSIRQLSLQLRAIAQVAAGSTTVDMARIIIFVDKEPQRGTPVATDICTTNNATGLRNWEQQQEKRFAILYDRLVAISPSDQSKRFEMYKKLSCHTRFNGDLGSDVSNNKIYMLMMSDNGGSAANLEIRYQTRLTYVDN